MSSKEKAAIICSQTSCFRSLILKLFHSLQGFVSSGSCCVVSVIQDKAAEMGDQFLLSVHFVCSPQLCVGFHQMLDLTPIFHAHN